MARYCPLFSGSSGNCTYIGTAEGGILVDAGVSAKRIETALRERDIDIWIILNYLSGDESLGIASFA